jgi:DNA modification methylase
LHSQTINDAALPVEMADKIDNLFFPANLKLLPSVTEIFELQLAFFESKTLSNENLIRRGAYFQSVNNVETFHFQLCKDACEALINNRSRATTNYFRSRVFSTGYATHSLFPYRGKFHPQLIRSLLNLIGINENETVLDPMCGSGTLNVEAALMNIKSIGVDKNPFACFMSKVKLDSLQLNQEQLQNDYKTQGRTLFDAKKVDKKLLEQKDSDGQIKRLFLLAYLDAMGYSRRTTKSLKDLFPVVLERYMQQVGHFLNTSNKIDLQIGNSEIKFGDARDLSFIGDRTIDGVITSPPYSFAIDYVDNDKPQLEYLGYDTDKLKQEMIGLSGQGLTEKLTNYFQDMDKVLQETARVLKIGKYAVIIIGSNDIQTKGVRLEDKVKSLSTQHNLKLVREIRKPIKGLRNTMKDEFVLIFKKV